MSTIGSKSTKLSVVTPTGGEATVILGDVEIAEGTIHHVCYRVIFKHAYPAKSGPGAMWNLVIHGRSYEPINRVLSGRGYSGVSSWSAWKEGGDGRSIDLSGNWRTETRAKWEPVIKELDANLPAIHDYLAAHPEIIEKHYQDNVVGVINALYGDVEEYEKLIKVWRSRITLLRAIREHERDPLNLDEVARGKFDRKEEKADS